MPVVLQYEIARENDLVPHPCRGTRRSHLKPERFQSSRDCLLSAGELLRLQRLPTLEVAVDDTQYRFGS